MASHRWRSVLFAPADRPEVTAKLPRSAPDVAVLDLEDAVAADAKADARRDARAVSSELAGLDDGPAVYIRVNAVPTSWFEADLADALHEGLAGVVVPKVETATQVDRIATALDRAGLSGLGLMVGLETATGVANAAAVLAPDRVTAGYFGAEDFIADMGGVRTAAGDEVLFARSQVVLAGRLGGTPVVDQIVADLDDADRFPSDAEAGRALGYAGKLCIHPAQVPMANAAFSPSPEAVHRARKLLEAYESSAAGVIEFEGQMIDEPLARQARNLIRSAGS